MDDTTKTEILEALRELIAEVAPEARLVAKYGGEVIALEPGNDKSFVGGILGYKDHVAIEFSKGAALDDPNGLLLGTGKTRRHLKFTALDEITTRNTKDFLRQATQA